MQHTKYITIKTPTLVEEAVSTVQTCHLFHFLLFYSTDSTVTVVETWKIACVCMYILCVE